MTIACGTDFSLHCGAAVEVAAALARQLGEPLALVHAFDERGVDELATPEVLQQLRARLHGAAEALRGEGLEVSEVLLRAGAADEALVDWLTRGGTPEAPTADWPPTEQPSLLVLSALGYRDESRWRMGGTVERILPRSPVPVLVVRQASALTAWARGERALRVFVAVDFSHASRAALPWLETLGRVGPCELVIGHVYWPWSEGPRLGIGGPIDLVGVGHAEIERVLIEELVARIGPAVGPDGWTVRVVQGIGRAAEHLVQLAEREGADLIVVGTHRYGRLAQIWHGSASQRVVAAADVSVACVPAPDPAPIPSDRIATIRRVLVPTDFSELGNRALPYGYGLAVPGGAVDLLHVVEPLRTLLAKQPRRQAAERAALRTRLAGLEPPGALERGIETMVHVVADDNVAAAICETGERLEVDAICISSHGRSGIAQTLAGSVARRVLTESRRPLFLIRPPRAS